MEFTTKHFGSVITLTEKKEGRSRRYFIEVSNPRLSGGYEEAELTKAELRKIGSWIETQLGGKQWKYQAGK